MFFGEWKVNRGGKKDRDLGVAVFERFSLAPAVSASLS
jgi:hypothetical protein